MLHPISTHAPARGATGAAESAGADGADFNPRSRTGSDLGLLLRMSRRKYFNPRSRTGSDDNMTQATLYIGLFQPTLPHGERRAADCAAVRQRQISTHAPARGATRGKSRRHPVFDISTHAPARGATNAVRLLGLQVKISTHAPARGATGTTAPTATYGQFQPTLPHGERLGGQGR